MVTWTDLITSAHGNIKGAEFLLSAPVNLSFSFDKIASEDFSAFMRILSLSKLLKNPNNMRGKARIQPSHGSKKKKRR